MSFHSIYVGFFPCLFVAVRVSSMCFSFTYFHGTLKFRDFEFRFVRSCCRSSRLYCYGGGVGTGIQWGMVWWRLHFCCCLTNFSAEEYFCGWPEIYTIPLRKYLKRFPFCLKFTLPAKIIFIFSPQTRILCFLN